ncbi:LacI family DNA-binding transcriptional regulator [Arthrobacter sp. R4-81]
MVNGQTVLTATGADSEHLDWAAWDVKEFRGSQATIRVVDYNRSGWGHPLADEFVLSDTEALPCMEEHDWLDWGKDFYATVSFNNTPDGKRVQPCDRKNGAFAFGRAPLCRLTGSTRNVRANDSPRAATMTTMVKVAKLAGVSISTVSHVLNGTRYVGDETRERVLKAIEETSYRQDALARAMRRSRTDSIGLIVSDGGEPAFAEMIRGVEETAATQGITLLLANSAEDPEREARAVEALLERRVDGLILARAAGSGPEALSEFANHDTPLVLMDRLSDDPYDQVGVENREPIKELVEHLVLQGHERILLVAGDTRVATLQERHEAFTEAMAAAGITPSGHLIVTAPDAGKTSADIEAALSAAEPPTAVIACSTVLAAAALQQIQQRGIRMPEDIAFATFDGFAYADLFEPQLTTVRQPAFQVGATAAELLTKRIADKSGDPTTVRLAPTIEYRASTGSGPSA